ncbi:MAG: nicotinate (nicotinamide) nucleotide adenylyltransferase [Proteobacteria bacterium]|nr:nicotinate (nicotinamide) nucleotide adenylyltransferase [Pseudomonadota bacterium]
MIGLFGGTFDPPHLGHIHLIQSLLKQFNFSKFYLIPNYRNPLKTKGPAVTAEERLLLLRTAIKGLDSRIEILDWEMRKQEPSFTIDTVKYLRTLHSEPLTFIIGDDIFSQLSEWKSAAELFQLVDWMVIKRSEEIVLEPQQLMHKLGIFDSHFVDKNHLAYSQDQRSIRFCDIKALPFSSTQMRSELRELWKKNKLDDPPQGIQRSVWLLIKEKRLYSVG